MRLFLAQLLELAHMSLTRPEELAMYLQRVNSGNKQIALFLGMIALSNATALFHVRLSYDMSFLFFLPLTSLLLFVLMGLWAFLAGAGIDALVRFIYPEKGVLSRNTIRMSALSLLPFVFALPVAVPARIFSFQGLFLFVMSGLLLVWHFVILYRSTRYHYELEKREALRNCLVMILLLAVFPVCFVLFAVMEVATLAGS